MTSRLILMIFLASSGVAHAGPEQGCPFPSSVKYFDGYYQGTHREHRWRSARVKDKGFLETFSGAVFVPGFEQDRKQGYLEKCVYKTGDRFVTLRYTSGDNPISMSLMDTTHWKIETGLFDQQVYICNDSQPDNCSFTVDEQWH